MSNHVREVLDVCAQNRSVAIGAKMRIVSSRIGCFYLVSGKMRERVDVSGRGKDEFIDRVAVSFRAMEDRIQASRKLPMAWP